MHDELISRNGLIKDITAAIAVVIIALFVIQFPEMRRYLKIRKM
jgi:hypothetical protein